MSAFDKCFCCRIGINLYFIADELQVDLTTPDFSFRRVSPRPYVNQPLSKL